MEALGAALKNLKTNRITLAVELHSLYGMCVRSCSVDSFFSEMARAFGLDKSQVSRYVGIIGRFGNADKTDLGDEWRAFSLSALTEMLNIPEAKLSLVSSEWEVKDIRAFKKLLERETCAAESDEPEIPVDRFARFKKFTRVQLCERIVELEQRLQEQKE